MLPCNKTSHSFPRRYVRTVGKRDHLHSSSSSLHHSHLYSHRHRTFLSNHYSSSSPSLYSPPPHQEYAWNFADEILLGNLAVDTGKGKDKEGTHTSHRVLSCRSDFARMWSDMPFVRPFNPPFLQTLSTHAINTPYQPILSKPSPTNRNANHPSYHHHPNPNPLAFGFWLSSCGYRQSQRARQTIAVRCVAR